MVGTTRSSGGQTGLIAVGGFDGGCCLVDAMSFMFCGKRFQASLELLARLANFGRL
jgi:hypothetical protein